MSRQSPSLQLILGFAILAAGQVYASHSHAEAIVSGVGNSLMIEVRDTSLQDVLAVLGAKFDLRVRGLSSLNRRVEGTYEGSLRGVVTRLLNGYDYVLKTDGSRLELIVLGVAKQSAAQAEYGQAVPIPTKRRSD